MSPVRYIGKCAHTHTKGGKVWKVAASYLFVMTRLYLRINERRDRKTDMLGADGLLLLLLRPRHTKTQLMTAAAAVCREGKQASREDNQTGAVNK